MRRRKAVTLLELIIAVVLLGLLAVLAIPRLTRASPTPEVTAALRADLKILRVAIDLYYRDHGAFPAQHSDGREAAGTPAAFVGQLTGYTDAHGHVCETPDADHCFGPYLRDGIPPCPVVPGPHRHAIHVISGPALPTDVAGSAPAGWVYSPNTGHIAANTTAADARGRPYASY